MKSWEEDFEKCKIIHILHFCLRKEVKKYYMQASEQKLNFVYL